MYVRFCKLAVGVVALILSTASVLSGATVLVLRFHNLSPYSDLNWVGESIAETVRVELSAAKEIVLGRDAREEGLKRLQLRPDAQFTKATLLKLGQTLGVDFLCYGSFDVKPENGNTSPAALKDSSVQIAAHYLDLRKMRDGKDFSEAGKLSDLSRLEEHLAWQSLKYLEPETDRPVEQYLAPQKFIRLEAKESYARGLLSTSQDQQAQWFRQANMLDSRLAGPAYELGKLSAAKRDYRQAITWFGRVPATDPRYIDARFRMGLAAYRAGDFNASVNYYREVAKHLPTNEVFNNLGAAENQMNMPAAIDDFRRAADGDANDTVYLFNLGAALLKTNQFDEATRRLQAVVDREPEDQQARALLERASRREPAPSNAKPLAPDRLKETVDETTFRQVKALLQPKGQS